MNLESHFKSLHPKIKALANRYANQTGIPSDDFESVMCEALWLVHEKHDVSKIRNLEAYIFGILKNRSIDLIRCKYGKSWKRSDYLEDKLPATYEGYNAVEVLVVDDANTESTAIDRVVGDKRQLIYSLVDESTTPIVEEMIATGDSLNRISARLGINHEKARRALRKLHKRYDEKKFGDYRSYIA